jgi:Saxitoxin biosynthesis operon protein SxtJ
VEVRRLLHLFIHYFNELKREKHLETILVLVFALGIFYWVSPNSILLVVAGILAFIGIFIPILSEKIHWAWMKLAHAIGFVMSKVLLTLVYLLILLPLAFLSKAFGKKTDIRLKPGFGSNFVDRNFTYTKDSMENTW